jgi:hypothetical protein
MYFAIPVIEMQLLRIHNTCYLLTCVYERKSRPSIVIVQRLPDEVCEVSSFQVSSE